MPGDRVGGAAQPAGRDHRRRASAASSRSRSGRSRVITILGELGVDLVPLLAGAGVAGVALGFGAQASCATSSPAPSCSSRTSSASATSSTSASRPGTNTVYVAGVVEAVSLRVTADARRRRDAVVRPQRRDDPAGRQQGAALGAGRARPRRSRPTTSLDRRPRGHRDRRPRAARRPGVAARASRPTPRCGASRRSPATSRAPPRRADPAPRAVGRRPRVPRPPQGRVRGRRPRPRGHPAAHRRRPEPAANGDEQPAR